MKSSYYLLLPAVVLTGLGAGLGFANAIGYMPAFLNTPNAHALSFWQHADHYFRARMPFFGNALLLSLLLVLIMLRNEFRTIGYWLIASAFAVSIVEMVVIFTQNLPINLIIEKLDVEKTLPENFEALKQKAARIFYLRSAFNISAFILTLAGAFVLLRNYFEEMLSK